MLSIAFLSFQSNPIVPHNRLLNERGASSFVHIARGATRPSASSAAAVAANFLFPADLILPPSVSLPPSFPLPFAMDGLDVLAQCEGPPQKFAKRDDDGDKSLVSAIILCFG